MGRWCVFLDQWERALASGLECHIVGDFNYDALVYSRQEVANKQHNVNLKPIIEELCERIIPHGVSQMVNVLARNNTILDHYYCNRPEKLSAIKAEFRGGSDNKLIIATRYSKVKVNGQRYITKDASSTLIVICLFQK